MGSLCEAEAAQR